MTLSTTVSRATYTGTGTTGPFAFPFRVFAATDLLVSKVVGGVETTFVYALDYTVAGVGDASGSITLTAPLNSGETLAIRRAPPLVQPVSIRNQGPYFASDIENEFDRQVMQMQSLKDQLDRSFGISESYDPAAYSLQVPGGVGGYVLGWNNDGTRLINGPAQTFAFLTTGLEGLNVKDPQFAGGAKGNGVADDTAAIQLAMNVGAAAGIPVYVPAGTYLLNGARQFSYRSNSGASTFVQDTLLVIPSGLKLVGAGYGAHLKVANGYSAGGDYRVIGPAAPTTSDVEITGVRFDGNGQNNLVIDSGANLRRALMLNMLAGDNIKIHHNWFENCPGRNVINLGNNSPGLYDFTNVQLLFNKFKNSGGAIVGNENQNDHSTIYLQSDGFLVMGNVATNDNQPGVSAPAKAVVCYEIHGKNGQVINNKATNYTSFGNAVAQVHDQSDVLWQGNIGRGITSQGINLANSGVGYNARRRSFINNDIELDNAVYPGGIGFYQSPTSIQAEEEDLVIKDNYLHGTVAAGTAAAGSPIGISLCAVNGATISGNRGRNLQGALVNLEANATLSLSIRKVKMDKNVAIDCGLQLSAARPWAFYIINTAVDNRVIENVTGEGNEVIRTLAAVLTPRGIRINGVAAGNGGYISNVQIEVPKCEGIQRFQRADQTNTFGFNHVSFLPRVHTHARATDPTAGFWNNSPLMEYLVNSDPISTGFFGKVPSTSGSAVSGAWVTGTQYGPGTWIRNAASTKVFRCIVGGVSGGVEPTGVNLGEQVVDGTVTWMYVDTALAVFKTFGAIS